MYNIHTISVILGLLVAVVALAILASRIRIPYSILLVLGGLLLGFIPGLPQVALNSDLVLLFFLPPLLYSSAWTTSWRDFRIDIRAISLLAIGLVLMTTAVVAIVAHMAIGLPWAAAFVLGAIVSPTDAIAATSIAQRLGVPQRIITIVEGESLVNDASGLVTYRFAVNTVLYGAFVLWQAGLQFVLVSVGGIAIGLVVGWIAAWIHRHLDNPPIEITITLLTPFIAYLPAQALSVSGVFATVAAGLYLTWRGPNIFSSSTRLQADTVWTMLVFILNSLIFILIGLQLRGILSTLTRWSPITLLWYGVLISLTVILARIIWTFPATYLPQLLDRKLRARDPYPNWRNIVIISWSGMRGVVSLASALAVPTTLIDTKTAFPGRDLIIFLTFCVIFATLVGQGLSLPTLIHWLGLKDDGTTQQEEAKARLTTNHAATRRLQELSREDGLPQEMIQHMQVHLEKKAKRITGQEDGQENGNEQGFFSSYQRVQLEVIQAERQALVRLRDQGDINDDVLRRIEFELDLQEQSLRA